MRISPPPLVMEIFGGGDRRGSPLPHWLRGYLGWGGGISGDPPSLVIRVFWGGSLVTRLWGEMGGGGKMGKTPPPPFPLDGKWGGGGDP